MWVNLHFGFSFHIYGDGIFFLPEIYKTTDAFNILVICIKKKNSGGGNQVFDTSSMYVSSTSYDISSDASFVYGNIDLPGTVKANSFIVIDFTYETSG